MVSASKVIPADLIVKMLKKVVYSGDSRTKYILSGGFPYTIEHMKEFEKSVATIAAVIYPGTLIKDGSPDGSGSSGIV